jgi:cytochrome c-type biogenesis protein CcmH/NrfG
MKGGLRHRSPRARLGLADQASAEDAERAHRELVDFLAGAPEGLRRWARGEIAAADEAYAALSGATGAGASRRRRPLKRLAVGIVTVAVAAGVVVGVYEIGGGQGKDEPRSGEAAEAPGLSPGDRVLVAKLMRKVKANPNDAATLVQLGNVFFNAQDYNSAGGWMKRAVAIEPRNAKARLALGAAEFNLGQSADARRDWLRVIAVDAENVEAYYDLGFLYLSRNPPDMARAKAMWRKVVELAPPGSSVAKTVTTHLEGLEKAGSAAGAPTGSGG